MIGTTLLLVGLFVARSIAELSCQSDSTLQLNLGNCTIPRPGESDVQSWGIKISVEGANELCFVPSTVLNDTFLTTDELCGSPEMLKVHGIPISPAQCSSRRGGLVSPSKLREVPISTLGSNTGWDSLKNSIDGAADVTLKLFRQSFSMTAGLIEHGQNSSASHLGLATNSTFLRTLKEKGLIGAMSFGLNVGSQSVQRPRGGSLVLGGWDQASMSSSSFYEFDIAKTKLQNRECPLQVRITALSMNVKTGSNSTNTKSIFSGATGIDVCIEPYDNLFRLPDETLSTLRDYIHLIAGSQVKFVGPSEYSNELANLEPGLVYPASVDFNATLRFTINDNMTIDVPHYEFQRPLRGLDQNGTMVLDPKFHELQIYGDPAPLNAPVLGKAFLSQVYLFVDYEAGKFFLAPQNLEATTSSPISSSACKNSSNTTSTGLTTTEKVLIAVGTLLGVLLLAIAGFVLYRWHRFRRAEAASHADKNALGGLNGSTLAPTHSALSGHVVVANAERQELNGDTNRHTQSIYTAPVGDGHDAGPSGDGGGGGGEAGSPLSAQRPRYPSDAGSGFSAPRASFATTTVANPHHVWSPFPGNDRADGVS
ncbi:hypothetical protein QBC35DRAFT_139597 [Podospora australis]|uniref:Peptidase A1 domain-containing protein n=1 Tax=Podospora australis TaxID=1536484 RepID=A0AAN6WJE2_9PEZI|nr:hypothetical protein QBC35DRAFT_139597 [Podospora australis]